ncbi:MAG TPA: trypsin-like peptidase domain-containing protein [Gemmatimonadaceae bacterium]|nr:trypsin-like peptidase domain-containing protein [Gemmatimonadaceae bacterium]
MDSARRSTRALAVLLALVIPASTLSAQEKSPDPAAEARGEALLMAGQYKAALKEFEGIRDADPTYAAAMLGIARSRDGMGRNKAALDAYLGYARLAPQDPAAYEMLGWINAELKRNDEALRNFRVAQRMAPGSSGAALGAGLMLREMGRREEAHRSLRDAARLDPRNAEIWGYLAALAMDMKQPHDASHFWSEALLRDPGYFDTRPAERKRWEKVAMLAPLAPLPQDGAAPVVATTVPKTASDSARAAAAVRPSMLRGPTSSGSGFVISRADGLVLTNKHVVRACQEVKVRVDGGIARAALVRATDPDDDLAVLRTILPPGPVASFRDDPPVRPGDDIVAVGYPLSGLLADQVNVSTGSVNALAGLYNDVHLLQMSAPVQPGSSGGPLFDVSGNVVGVVVTKLNAKIVAEETGDIPQNVNFAIKGQVAREFLRSLAIPYRTGASVAPRSNADVGELGRQVTVLVECWR